MKDAFLELFLISQCKEARVTDNMQVSNGIESMECAFFTSCTGLGGRGGACLFWDVVFSQMETRWGGMYSVDYFKD
jgi:hypothetical protein